MVTAELAVALPAVVLTAVLAVTFLGVLAAQLRALDAAAVAARLAGRGEPTAAVTAQVVAIAPGAKVALSDDNSSRPGVVLAEVSVRVTAPGLGRILPAFVVHERAAAPREPDGPP